MPSSSGRFTPQEHVFVKRYAATGDANYAAHAAGYSSPAKRAHQTLAKPAIQAAIVEEQNAALHNELLPLAVERLRKILANDKAPASAHVQAARLVLDRTLGAGQEGEPKEPWQMTAAELNAAIQALERRASELAKPVVDLKANPETGIFD